MESEADLFQTDLDFGSMDSEAFTRDVYQRCARLACPGGTLRGLWGSAGCWRRAAAASLPACKVCVHVACVSHLPPSVRLLPRLCRYGVFTSHEDEEVDSEQPQWAMELMSAASAAGAVAPGPGKLPMPTSGGPQPFPVYDSSSSSSSEEDSDEEHALGSGGQAGRGRGRRAAQGRGEHAQRHACTSMSMRHACASMSMPASYRDYGRQPASYVPACCRRSAHRRSAHPRPEVIVPPSRPLPAPPAANSSSDAEVSVTPAPMPDSDVLLVDSGSSGGGDGSCAAAAAAGSVPARPPLGSDDADMEADAVMLEQEDVVLQEYDTAEQLISLAQLSLEDPAEGAAGAAQPAAGEQPAADEQSSGSGEAAEAEAEAAPQGEAGGGPPAVAPTSA